MSGIPITTLRGAIERVVRAEIAIAAGGGTERQHDEMRSARRELEYKLVNVERAMNAARQILKERYT